MGVFRELAIEFGGKEYIVVPSMALLRRIEAAGVSIVEMNQRFAEGKPYLGAQSLVLWKMLESAGCKASEEEVYSALADMPQGKQAEIIIYILTAFVPTATNPKNLDAPAA